jgi:DNA mismatch repair protein MutL
MELAFQHHATSKLQEIEDLSGLDTLGFRGEALASIAAVARVSLASRSADEETGTLVVMDDSKVVRRQSIGMAVGTIVTVEKLFARMPARLKFLAKPATEARLHTDLISRYALAYPHIRFSLTNENRQSIRPTGDGSLRDVWLKLHGLESARRMLDLDQAISQNSEEPKPGKAPVISGLISSPDLSRSNRRHLTLFVNRRWIRNHALVYAVEEAYRGLLPKGRHPMGFIELTLDPSELDVNVHPTKAEVRFADQSLVFAALQRQVRRTLMAESPVHRFPVAGRDSAVGVREGPPLPGWDEWDIAHPESARRPDGAFQMPDAPGRRLPALRVVGQMSQTYIVAEGPEGLYLIDQHASHERVLYDQLLAQRARSEVASQALLEPLSVSVDSQQAAWLEGHLDELGDMGFVIEPFGAHTFLVRAVPAVLEEGDRAEIILETIDTAMEETSSREREWVEGMAISLVCHGAVRAGQTLSMDEMREIVRQLEVTESPRTCPHGRPTMIHFSDAELAREFGRR